MLHKRCTCRISAFRRDFWCRSSWQWSRSMHVADTAVESMPRWQATWVAVKAPTVGISVQTLVRIFQGKCKVGAGCVQPGHRQIQIERSRMATAGCTVACPTIAGAQGNGTLFVIFEKFRSPFVRVWSSCEGLCLARFRRLGQTFLQFENKAVLRKNTSRCAKHKQGKAAVEGPQEISYDEIT